MTDLPNATSAGTTTPDPITGNQLSSGNSIHTAISLGNKEAAPFGGTPDHHEGVSDATGQELELPKEVAAAGVRIQPTTVSIPAAIAKLGVKPSGVAIPVQTTSTVVLPLTDDQIAKGLNQSITSSVRWLAEWCVRRLKHLHITLKNVHGSFVRTSEH